MHTHHTLESAYKVESEAIWYFALSLLLMYLYVIIMFIISFYHHLSR